MPQSIVLQHAALRGVERYRGDRRQAEVVVRLIERRKRDVITVQFLDHALKRGFVGHADEDDKRRLSSLHERVGHIECRVVGLNDLLLDRNVVACEEVKFEIGLGIDLVHVSMLRSLF